MCDEKNKKILKRFLIVINKKENLKKSIPKAFEYTNSVRIRIRNTVEKMDDLYLGNKPNVKVSVESIKATGKIVKCLSTGTWIFKVFFSYFFKASEKVSLQNVYLSRPAALAFTSCGLV